jgi:hypothetical protein
LINEQDEEVFQDTEEGEEESPGDSKETNYLTKVTAVPDE